MAVPSACTMCIIVVPTRDPPWRQTRYVQGFDETHPESQVEFDKNGRPIKETSKQDKLKFDKPKSDKSKGDKPSSDVI